MINLIQLQTDDRSRASILLPFLLFSRSHEIFVFDARRRKKTIANDGDEVHFVFTVRLMFQSSIFVSDKTDYRHWRSSIIHCCHTRGVNCKQYFISIFFCRVISGVRVGVELKRYSRIIYRVKRRNSSLWSILSKIEWNTENLVARSKLTKSLKVFVFHGRDEKRRERWREFPSNSGGVGV